VRISLFDRKELVSMNRFRLLATLLFIFAAVFQSHPAQAQIQTYYYRGPAWDLSQCDIYGGGSTPPCTNGNVSGSLTLAGVPWNYSGGVSANAVSWTLSATSVGSFTKAQTSRGNTFNLNNGQVNGWDWGGYLTIGIGGTDIYTTNNPGGYDDAVAFDPMTGADNAAGFVMPPSGIWFSPIALGPSCAADAPSDAPPLSGKVSCGEPFDVGSGNMFLSAPDYATVGQNPLAFTRYFNSFSVPDTYAVALGSNWRHSFDRYLHIINPSAIYGVTAERETGQYVNFSSSSGTYTPDSDVDYSLSKSGTTWTLTAPDDTVETYSQSGAEATLQSVKRRNGYTQTMHYTSGRLSSVSDTYGPTIGLSYTSGLLTGLTTPDSLSLTAFSSGGHQLSTVAYNTSPATHQTYAYGDARFPAAITGITDENGHSYSSWTYDSSGRMATSQLAGGVNYTSASYFDDSGDRHVTGPLGITETYKFTYLQGIPKVTEIDRASNGTVSFASRGFTYDTNGFTQSATDWNGNQTWFTNNSHGLPTSIVFASGSTVSHTTSITYDTTWARLAHVITTPGLTITNNYASGNGTLLTRVLSDTTSTSIPVIAPKARTGT
jgi:Domain of unknown function (DUF6531)